MFRTGEALCCNISHESFGNPLAREALSHHNVIKYCIILSHHNWIRHYITITLLYCEFGQAYLVGQTLHGRGHNFCLQKSRMRPAGLVYFFLEFGMTPI